MEDMWIKKMADVFEGCKKSAAKGHAESLWILNVLKSLTIDDEKYNDESNADKDNDANDTTNADEDKYFSNKDVLKAAFLNTIINNDNNNDNLITNGWAWFWAAYLSDFHSLEQKTLMKMSSDAGNSWGQVEHAKPFSNPPWSFFSEDTNYLILLEKASRPEPQSGPLSKLGPDAEFVNPKANFLLGCWHEKMKNNEKALYHFHVAANLGWKSAREKLAQVHYHGLLGVECNKVQSARWSIGTNYFFNTFILGEFMVSLPTIVENVENIKPTPLLFELGKGLYWTMKWDKNMIMIAYKKFKVFSDWCMNYYCSTVETRQKSILLFLHFWNKTTGVKDIGKLICHALFSPSTL